MLLNINNVCLSTQNILTNNHFPFVFQTWKQCVHTESDKWNYTHFRKWKTFIDILKRNLFMHPEINTSYLWTLQSQVMLQMVAFSYHAFINKANSCLGNDDQIFNLLSKGRQCYANSKQCYCYLINYEREFFLSWNRYKFLGGICIYFNIFYYQVI